MRDENGLSKGYAFVEVYTYPIWLLIISEWHVFYSSVTQSVQKEPLLT